MPGDGMERSLIRLEILKLIYSHASLASAKNPTSLIGIAKELEAYVAPDKPEDGRKRRRRRTETEAVSASDTPELEPHDAL